MSSSIVSLAGLAQMVTALEARKAHLLSELRQTEHDLDAIRQTMEMATRLGFGPAPMSMTTSGPTPTRNGASGPASAPTDGAGSASPMPRPSAAPPDLDLTFSALQSLGPVRADRDIPPKVQEGRRIDNEGLPFGGAELQALRESMHGIAREASAAPPGAGGRRYRSAKALVPGEPLAPSLLAVLQAANRPLTSHEAAVAMLEARGIHLEGVELAAVTNRATALLGQQAQKDRVRRLRMDGLRHVRWVISRDLQHKKASLT